MTSLEAGEPEGVLAKVRPAGLALAIGQSHRNSSASDSGATGLAQLLRGGKCWAEKQGSLEERVGVALAREGQRVEEAAERPRPGDRQEE